MVFYPPRLPQNTPSWFQFVLVAAYLAMMVLGVIGLKYITTYRWKIGIMYLVGLAVIGIGLILAVRKFQ